MRIETALRVVLVAATMVAVSGCSTGDDTQSRSTSISIEPDKPFQWRKNTTLEATEPSTIVLPGAILPEDTPIGEIIKASDDDFGIMFTPNADGSGIETVILRFKKGQAVTLNRSCEAVLVDDKNQSRTFLKTEP